MKKRLSILIGEEVIGRAKRLAVKEGRPLSDVIQDALLVYLNREGPDPQKRKNAYQVFCEQPMRRITKKQLKKILEIDGNE
jgi:hypothetical protein